MWGRTRGGLKKKKKKKKQQKSQPVSPGGKKKGLTRGVKLPIQKVRREGKPNLEMLQVLALGRRRKKGMCPSAPDKLQKVGVSAERPQGPEGKVEGGGRRKGGNVEGSGLRK